MNLERCGDTRMCAAPFRERRDERVVNATGAGSGRFPGRRTVAI
jgi:hypothetical protein